MNMVPTGSGSGSATLLEIMTNILQQSQDVLLSFLKLSFPQLFPILGGKIIQLN
jgi:hypothetical protein